MTIYKPKEFAEIIGVCPRTLDRWDSSGKFCARKNPSGRKFYTEEDLADYWKKSKKETFLEYSKRFLNDSSSLGDLARDMQEDENKQNFDTTDKQAVYFYLQSKGACDSCIEAFREMSKLHREGQL